MFIAFDGRARQKQGKETGPDPNTLGLRAGLQVQPGAEVLSKGLRQKPIYEDLGNMAGVEIVFGSVGTGEWGCPSPTDCLFFAAR